MLLLHGNELPLERVDVVWVAELVKDDVDVVLAKTLCLEEVLHLEGVQAHLLALVNQFLLKHRVVGMSLVSLTSLHGELLLKAGLLLLGS